MDQLTDILFMAQSRPEFTAAAIDALERNTEWDRVASVRLYWDDRVCSRTAAIMAKWTIRIPPGMTVYFEPYFRGGPVDGMLDTLKQPGAPIFAKVDNDVIVPPGWLGSALEVMQNHPELDLLGLEPPLSRTPAPWSPPRRWVKVPEYEVKNALEDYALCDSIGGVGLMRRRAFAGRPAMVPHSTYGGFTNWQLENPDVTKGWIVPPLSLFLLDRLPLEPWATLSKQYIAAGVQRPWTNYGPEAAALWRWWLERPGR